MDNDELIIEAGRLSDAMNGLALFTSDHFGTTDVNLEDINALTGLITSIKYLAENHAAHVFEQMEVTADGK